MQKSIRKFLFLTLIGVCITISQSFAESPVKIFVTTNHTDWVYKVNEKVKFKVVVTQNDKFLKNVKVVYEIGQEKMTPQIKENTTLKDGQLEIEGGSMNIPGFLRCTVKVEFNNKTYTGLATAAFDPEKIAPTTTTPTDFRQFWENAITENKKIPLDPIMTLLPAKCTEKLNVYQINFQNYKYGMRVYGILCVPKAPGKYPAILEVPGAGVRPYKGDFYLAEKGAITLQIGIHGIPVTLDSIVYANLKYGALDGYPVSNMDNRDSYYYKHVYLGCVRAIDFIATLPEYDGQNLAVSGGSQGGALTIATSALDNRVKCLSCFHPALCDLTGYSNGRAGGWPSWNNFPTAKTETSKYYDTVNFAKLLKIDGFYTFGFNDETCPPTSMYSAYNSITAPKSLLIVKELGHYGVQEQWAQSNEFLLKHLNIWK